MTAIELPDDVAAALEAAAAERGVSVPELIVGLVAQQGGAEGLSSFVGCLDSGDPDWAGSDDAELRKAVAARRAV